MEPKQKAMLVVGAILSVIGVPLMCFWDILNYLLEVGVLKVGVYPHFGAMVTILGDISLITGLVLILYPLISSIGKFRLTIGIILAVLILATIILYVFLPFINSFINDVLAGFYPYKYTPFVALYPYSHRGMVPLNQTEFELDIKIAKEMGFRGVKLWNVECFYDDNTLSWAMDKLSSAGLSVIIPFNFFDRTYKFPFPSQAWTVSGFPNNVTQVNAYVSYVANVTKIVQSSPALLSYLIYYPFNESDPSMWAKVPTTAYLWSLQEIINAIWNVDKLHPIYLGVMLWRGRDSLGIYKALPKDFLHVYGFAFQAYTSITDNIDIQMIDEFYNYWITITKNVFISEWGVHVTGTALNGRASSEAKKVDMIKAFLRHIHFWSVTWCYFGLHDFPPESADFGLIDDNHNLKLSGETMKATLIK